MPKSSSDETLPNYELFAIRYAERAGRRADHFMGGDPHDGPMQMDYFTWVAKGPDRTFLIDTGFDDVAAAARGRALLRCPIEAMRLLGIDPATIADVVITHLHYDHVGNFHKLPNARFHIQDREMAFATGRNMRYRLFGVSYSVEDVVGMVRLNFKGRVAFHDGDAVLAPGLTLHRTGGHTAGLQVVRVHTKRGWVVLASDVGHYYENMRSDRPSPIAYRVDEMIEAHRTVERLADSPRHIVPGHDPLVMQEYPAPAPNLEGIVIRLDVPPKDVAGVPG